MGSHDGSNGTQEAVEADGLVMPIIDFSKFLHGDTSTRQSIAAEISQGFQTSGFIYLVNHGIPPSTITNIFNRSATFFKRPQHQKDSLGWTTPESNRGYVSAGREKLTLMDQNDRDEIANLRASNTDLKESMEIGRSDQPDQPNQWPDKLDNEGEEFTADMKDFFETCKDLHVNVMRAIGLGMGLPAQFFDSYTDAGDNNLRLLHYPAVLKSVFRHNPDQVRAGAHSDYGSITLLFQDSIGGLQVQSPRGTWVSATPVPNAIIVNAGDLLNRWSNGLIKSTLHRVVQPPIDVVAAENKRDGDEREEDEEEDEDEVYPERYSIAYFCNPNFDRVIEALPGTYAEEGSTRSGDGKLKEKMWEPIKSGDYLVMRLAATF